MIRRRDDQAAGHTSAASAAPADVAAEADPRSIHYRLTPEQLAALEMESDGPGGERDRALERTGLVEFDPPLSATPAEGAPRIGYLGKDGHWHGDQPDPSYGLPAAAPAENCPACWHLWRLHGPRGCSAKVYPAHSLTGEPCPCEHPAPAADQAAPGPAIAELAIIEPPAEVPVPFGISVAAAELLEGADDADPFSPRAYFAHRPGCTCPDCRAEAADPDQADTCTTCGEPLGTTRGCEECTEALAELGITRDPLEVLEQLGARWSPDAAAYAAGTLPAHLVRCVLCEAAPCKCRYCLAPYNPHPYLEPDAEPSPCGMRIDPATGECPRGHTIADTFGPLCAAPGCPATAILGAHTPGVVTRGPAGDAACIAEATS